MKTNNKISLCFLNSYETLEEALAKTLEVSKNQIKKQLESKRFRLQKVNAQSEYHLPAGLINYGHIYPEYTGSEVKIIGEDKYFLILSKPAQVHMHPLGYDESDNLLSFLATIRPELLDVNFTSYDRGLLYRLDYQTSGVAFYAKSNEVYQEIRLHFNEHTRNKTYLAIVEGKVENGHDLGHYLCPTGAKGHKMEVVRGGENQTLLCELSYKPLKYNAEEDVSLIQVSLKTGARHQIRCQMAYIGHPVLGDDLYGGREDERLYLHAYHYQMEFKGELYSYFAKEMDLFEKYFDLEFLFLSI